jgi:hypothetical protein
MASSIILQASNFSRSLAIGFPAHFWSKAWASMSPLPVAAKRPSSHSDVPMGGRMQYVRPVPVLHEQQVPGAEASQVMGILADELRSEIQADQAFHSAS